MPEAAARSSNIDVDSIERLQATQESTDEESIMGMSTEKELVEGEGGGGRSRNDSYESFDGSAVSDDDYYRQDYFMLGLSESKEKAHAASGDPEISSLSHQIMEETNTKRLSSAELAALTDPDTAKGADKADSEAGYANFHVDAGNPLDLAVPAKKDYRSHFEKFLSAEPVRDNSNSMPVLPQDVEFQQEYTAENSDSGTKSMDQSNEGGSSATALQPSESSTGMVGEMNGAAGSAQDPTKEDTAPSATEHPTTPGGLQNPRHTRTSSRDKGFPYPASSPKNSPRESGSGIDSQNDFATVLKQATRSLPPESGNSNDSQNDFATVLKQATRSKSENNLDFAAVLKKATRSATRSSTPGSDNNDSQNNFASVLKLASHKLRHNSEPITPIEHMPLSPSVGKSEMADDPKTPVDDHKAMISNIKQALNVESYSSPTAHASHGVSPSNYPDNIAKLARENHKLRKRRKELLNLLSSTAQQFSAYERVCSQKICTLEEKNRHLQNPKNRIDVELASSVSKELDKYAANQPGAKMYDGEVVRRLSSGVLMQETQLKSKDELITQLKLRCEVLKHSLMDKDGENLQEKKVWEEERSKLLKKFDSSSPVKQNHGELLSKKMECTRLKKELETALNDMTMLTTALETNNEVLDAAVLELDKLQEWKSEYGEAALVVPLDIFRTTETEKLRSELKEKDEETAQLQNDLESSLNEIGELRESVNAAATAKGYNDFQHAVEDLKDEANASKRDADIAKERIAQLESELESKKGEINQLRNASGSVKPFNSMAEPHDQLNGVSHNKLSTVVDDASKSTADGGNATAESLPPIDGQHLSSTSRRGGKRFGLGNLRGAFGAPRSSSDTASGEPADFPTMLKQRDLRIKSLDAMIHSYLRIIDKMKGDIERMDSEKEEAEYISLQKIEQLVEENKTYEIQVLGFEKAFMNLNEERGTTLKPSHDDKEIVDDNMFMWDEHDESEAKDDTDVRSECLALQRLVTELESSSSFQEDQIEKLKADLVKLRVKSLQEKEFALAHLAEENEIIKAQRSALENQLVEINKSAGVLRESLSPVNDGVAGSDPMLVTQVVMLEKANKVLESSVDSLRSNVQQKLTPLLERIALLEEEKRMIEDEMNTKLGCREVTICNLENSLNLYLSKKKGSKHSTQSAAPDRAAGGH